MKKLKANPDEKEKKRRSFTWKHFNLVVNNIKNSQTQFACCNYCKTKYKLSKDGKGDSTSNMIIHLKNKHEIEEKSFDDGETEFVGSISLQNLGEYR